MTDGWYPIRAILDKPLSSLLLSNKIQIGTKLCIYGANLIGSDQAAPPLEVLLRIITSVRIWLSSYVGRVTEVNEQARL